MSGEISKPSATNQWVATDGSSILHTGETQPDQVTTSGLAVFLSSDDTNEHLANCAPYAAQFPALPAQGEPVEARQIYNNSGTLVMARQSHNRTEHDPSAVPALFAWHREGAAGELEYINNEEVYEGWIRTDGGKRWRAIVDQGYVVTKDGTFDGPEWPFLEE